MRSLWYSGDLREEQTNQKNAFKDVYLCVFHAKCTTDGAVEIPTFGDAWQRKL